MLKLRAAALLSSDRAFELKINHRALQPSKSLIFPRMKLDESNSRD
jgi:hypothetical protein